MFGNLGEMAKLMQMAKELPKRIKEIKAEMALMEYTATSPCGGVRATVSGDFMVKSIELDGTADGAVVRDTVNTAISMAKAGAQAKMSEVSGGMDLPDIF